MHAVDRAGERISSKNSGFIIVHHGDTKTPMPITLSYFVNVYSLHLCHTELF